MVNRLMGNAVQTLRPLSVWPDGIGEFMSKLVLRTIKTGSRRTSVRLEPELWDAFDRLCEDRRLNPEDIFAQLDKTGRQGSFTSELRVFIVQTLEGGGKS